MTFEEFFKKKKINLATFGQAEAALFAEFKAHFELMGEKSFDHTKKYWFNKLRRLYPAPPEIKAEKVIIENQLAEQTIIETLTEPTAPKVGFTPRFKAGATTAPKLPEPTPQSEDKPNDAEQTATPAPKVGFTPRFKAGVTATPKPPEATSEPETKPEEEAEKPAAPAPKVGFTPRFKAGVTAATKPSEPIPESKPKEKPEEEKPVVPAPKVGFTPRFKAGVTKPKTDDDKPSSSEPEL